MLDRIPDTAALTAATRRPRLRSATWALARIVLTEKIVQAALFLLILPDQAVPASLAAAFKQAGIDPTTLAGRGWPVADYLNQIFGLDAVSVLLLVVICVTTFFLALRRGYVLDLKTALTGH